MSKLEQIRVCKKKAVRSLQAGQALRQALWRTDMRKQAGLWLGCFCAIGGPVLGCRCLWAQDYDKQYCFDSETLGRQIAYVDRHGE